MKRGFLISSKCVEKVSAVFQDFKTNSNPSTQSSYKLKIPPLLWSEDSSLDDFYLALYIQNLFEIEESIAPVTTHSDKQKAAILSTSISSKFPEIREDTSFYATLLDEFEVANLRKFRFAVEDTIPYDVALSSIKTHGTSMEFNIYAKQGSTTSLKDGLIDWPFANKNHFDTSAVWNEIKENHSVQSLTLLPA